jgi:2-polyprenyl-3-methyl-5-hydroxy-6-metoxy-1,4-benzoquinol methylase
MSVAFKCHLCGSDSCRVVYEPKKSAIDVKASYAISEHDPNESLGVVSCRQCGLSVLHPAPDIKAVVDNYISMEDEKYVKEAAGRRAAARLILKNLARYKKGGKLLDIGCATGFLLDEARKQGWEVYGVEFSNWAVKYAREKLNLPHVTQGTLKEANFSKGFFDAIIMTDVIEHLVDPKSTLDEIRQLLRPDGIFCCTTPDIDSTISKMLKAKWWGINQSHLFYFNRTTLEEMFAATGFFPIKTHSHARTFSLGYWFSNFAAYKPSMKFLANFLERHPRIASLAICLDLGDQLVSFARRSREMKYLHELEADLDKEPSTEKKKVVAVLPAYNAAKTLAITLKDIPRDVVDEVLLVDDVSKDNTAELARQLGIKVIRHEKNTGYGGNQKTCYKEALKMGADIVVMVHPDYQYDPTAIKQLIEPILKERADAVFGSRMMKGGALQGGMPIWKYNANILLTALENVSLGIYLTEYHSGFRAYSRRYLTRVNFEANSDGFVFDTEIIVQGVLKFMRFEEVPIRTRYFDEASSIKVWPSIVYGLNILKTLFKHFLYKAGWHFKQFK